MELQQYFDELAETLSKKFPTIKNTVYLYLLIAVVMILDRGNQWLLAHNSILINWKIYKEIESLIYDDYNKIVDIVLNDLVNRDLFSGIKNEDLILTEHGIVKESPFKDSFRELCKYLVAKCLQIENQVELCNVEDLWKEIAKREPNAIQLENQVKIHTIEDFLSQKIGSDEPRSVQAGNNNSSVNFSKLSDKSYQELSEGFIAQSFYFEKNYLQRFNKLDEILAKTANPKPEQEIFNPNCGIGSSFVKLQKQFPNHELRFTGRVDDSFFYILCEANLLAHNVKAFVSQEEILDSDIEVTFLGEMPDIALGIVPLNLEITGKLNKRFFPLSHKRKKVEYSFIELMINCLGENGKAVVVVPEEFLYRWNAKGFKKEYLKNDWVESVLSLPEDTFKEYGSVKTAVVVFNKNKVEKGFITFKSADSRFEETTVSLSEVLSLDRLDLRVSLYASEEIKELKSILSKYPQDEVKRIEDLIDSSISGYNYSPDNRIVEDSSENLPYVRVKDLLNSNKDFTLDVSKVERVISREKARKKTVIDFSAVLVSKIAPKLKPTLFYFAGQPIVIGSDVIALKIREEVNVEYFLTQLYSRLVQTQVEMVSSGSIINRISKEDFLNIQIILPSLAEQKLQIFERSGVNEDKAIIQEQISIAKKEIETTEYDVIAAIMHNLNQKLGQIVDDYVTLILFLQNKEKNQMPIRFNETLRPLRNGEVVDNIPTFSKVANRLQNNLLDTAYTMKTTENILQKSAINTEELDIIEFFSKSIKVDFENPHFTIKIESKLKSLIILADTNALKDAFRNLIENAKKHGITHTDQKYQIVFEVSKYTDNSGDNYARIVYKNTGNPFPKSYRFEDYIRLGTRMGKNKGTGIGGFFVKKVLDLHKGSFKGITLHENNQETF